MSFSVRRLSGNLAVVTLGLALVSCAASPTALSNDPLTAESFASAASAVADTTWAIDMNTASGHPTVAAGVVLNFALNDENELEIIALDAKNGKLLWQAPTSMGEQTQGTSFSPVVLSADETIYAAYLTPAAVSKTTGEFGNTIRIANITTGEVLHESPTAIMGGDWGTCATPNAFCTKVATADGWNEASFTVEGDYTESTSQNFGSFSAETVSRNMGNGITLLGDGSQTTELAYFHNGEVLETYPLSQIAQTLPFPVTQVVGETFTDNTRKFVGLTLLLDPKGETSDFSPALVISLNTENGEFNFSRTDVLGCSIGAMLCSPVSSAAEATADTTSKQQSDTVVFHGVDLRTGEDTWSVEIEEFAALVPPPAANSFVLPSGYHFVTDRGAAKIINEATGELTEATANDRFLCTIPKTFTEEDELAPEPDPLQATGAHFAAACSLTEVFEDPSDFTELVVRAGATAHPQLNTSRSDDNFYVIQTSTQVLGYRL